MPLRSGKTEEMGMTNFTYNGGEIRAEGEHLNLTDMWKAGGSPKNREPYQWARKEGRSFVEVTALNLNLPMEQVYQTTPGRHGGGTKAHWQIGLAYAKYLSDEFHYWCNTVIRAYMEGNLIPADGAKASNFLTTLDEEQQRLLGPVIHFMEQSFAKLFEQQHDLRKLVSGVRTDLEDLRTRVPQRRREIKPETRQRHITILIQLGCRGLKRPLIS